MHDELATLVATFGVNAVIRELAAIVASKVNGPEGYDPEFDELAQKLEKLAE